MTSMFPKKDWSTQTRRALSATEIVVKLTELPGWQLSGDGADVAIEKTYRFANYHETMAFVNALAWIVHAEDHHPELTVTYNRCTVRWNTHSVSGISDNDFICAARADSVFARAG